MNQYGRYRNPHSVRDSLVLLAFAMFCSALCVLAWLHFGSKPDRPLDRRGALSAVYSDLLEEAQGLLADLDRAKTPFEREAMVRRAEKVQAAARRVEADCHRECGAGPYLVPARERRGVDESLRRKYEPE